MGGSCSGTGKYAWWLMVVGALNWGLVGLGTLMGSDWNVVNMVLGQWATVEAVVYLLVGLSAVYLLSGKCK
jgi:uncharacterized protein